MRVPIRIIAAVLLAFATIAATAHPAVPHPRYNILEVMLDDAKYGQFEQVMPQLAAMPGAQTFTNAYDEVALCCPSRVQALTGQDTSHTRVENIGGQHDGRSFDDTHSLATALQGTGYTTALIGKYLNGYGVAFHKNADAPPGWNDWLAFVGTPGYGVGKSGYRLTDGTTVTRYAPTTDGSSYSTTVLGQAANTFLEDHQQGPWYLAYHPYAPHDPHLPAPEHRYQYRGAALPYDPAFDEADVSDKPAYIQARASDEQAWATSDRRRWETQLSVDDVLANLVATLKATGQDDHTIIIVTSDNGWAGGDHRWLHKKCEYDACLHVPLIWFVPGQPAATHTGMVRVMDYAPTIEALTGAAADRAEDGTSYAGTLLGGPEPTTAEVYQHWAGYGAVGPANPPGFDKILTPEYAYTELFTGERELYDLRTDPFELSNVVNDPAYSAVVADLHQRLANHDAAYPTPHGSMTGKSYDTD